MKATGFSVKAFAKKLFELEWLDLARFAVCANAFFEIWGLSPKAMQPLPSELLKPLFLFHISPPPQALPSLQILCLALIVACALGFSVRLTAFSAAVLSAFVLGWRYNFGYIQWADAIIPMSLLGLAVVPQVLAMRFLLVYSFFAGGISKLRHTGIDWWHADTQKIIFEYNQRLFGEWFSPTTTAIYDLLLGHPILLSLSGAFVLVVELLSPAALFSKRAALVLIPCLLILHISFFIAFGQNFLYYYWPFYLYWLKVPSSLLSWGASKNEQATPFAA